MVIQASRSNILHGIDKPSDCLMLIAFSLTEEDFLRDLKPEAEKDYAKGVQEEHELLPTSLYRCHHVRLVKTIIAVTDEVRRLGVTVRLRTTIEDLGDLSGFKVVTLFAHFNEEMQKVELSDKLYSCAQFVDTVDKSFEGFWDLSVCNSIYLQDEIKRVFGDKCFTRANGLPAEIKLHLVIYKNIIERLAKACTNYFTEMANCRMQLAPFIKNQT